MFHRHILSLHLILFSFHLVRLQHWFCFSLHLILFWFHLVRIQHWFCFWFHRHALCFIPDFGFMFYVSSTYSTLVSFAGFIWLLRYDETNRVQRWRYIIWLLTSIVTRHAHFISRFHRTKIPFSRHPFFTTNKITRLYYFSFVLFFIWQSNVKSRNIRIVYIRCSILSMESNSCPTLRKLSTSNWYP